jgi:uncharacterized protein DUF4238
MNHKKQHILAKTYLKYFSDQNDGKNISVLYLNNKYKKDIKQYNSGDKIFWKDNFYNSNSFKNPKTIELYLGKEVENNYHELMKEVFSEKPINDLEVKRMIYEWLYFSKLRSPKWRDYLKYAAMEKGIQLGFDSEELREMHMTLFSDNNILKHYGDTLTIKKWKIYISPNEHNWITSDNPGFSINCKEFKKNPKGYKPNPLCYTIQHDTIIYLPLSKKYCLEIFPYLQVDDVKSNFDNEAITYKEASIAMIRQINYWTLQTAHEIIISSRKNELINFEKIIYNS